MGTQVWWAKQLAQLLKPKIWQKAAAEALRIAE